MAKITFDQVVNLKKMMSEYIKWKKSIFTPSGTLKSYSTIYDEVFNDVDELYLNLKEKFGSIEVK